MGLGNRFLQRFVKNDAMKIGELDIVNDMNVTEKADNTSSRLDPPEIYNPRVFILALCSCFGGTLYVFMNFKFDNSANHGLSSFGMDIGIIGGVITQDAFKSFVQRIPTVDGQP